MPSHANNDHAHPAGNDQPSTIRYLDGSSLKRPFDLDKRAYPFILAVMAVALVIGGIWASGFIDNVIHGAEHSARNVEEAINRGVTLDLPDMKHVAVVDDDTVRADLAASGFQIIDMNEVTGTTDATGIDLVKIPSDKTVTDAAVVYAAGLNKLSAADAASYLVGSWRLMTTRAEFIDVRVRYADFASPDAATAIATALNSEGLADAPVTDEGVDSSGNTYKSGTVDIDGSSFNWQVSVCPLTDVYGIIGLPDTAQYVGIRLYQ